MNQGVQNVIAVCVCIALASIVLYAFRSFWRTMSHTTVARGPKLVRIDAEFDPSTPENQAKWVAQDRLRNRNHLAANALNGLLACPPGQNDQAKDRSPEALAELAILYANELIALEDVPVRSSAEVRREAWAFRNEMMRACGGQVLTQSQLEMLEALEPLARVDKCAELRAQWEIDRVKLREEIEKENDEIATRVKKNAEALKRAKEIRAARESGVTPS